MNQLIDLHLDEKIKCSEEEQQECFKLAEKFVRMAERVRSQGMPVLEDELDSNLPYLMRTGLHLIIDGAEPALVDKLLTNYICSSTLKGKALLKRLIIREGILSLQRADTPRIMRMQLLSYFGEDFASRVVDDTAQALEDYFKSIVKDLPASDDTLILDEEIGVMKDRAIQKLVREIDPYVLASGLAGVSGLIRTRVMRNMPPRAALLLIDEMQGPEAHSHEEIVEAQEIILQIIRQLQEQEEI